MLLALKTDPLISDFKVRLFASASWNWRTELTAQGCSGKCRQRSYKLSGDDQDIVSLKTS